MVVDKLLVHNETSTSVAGFRTLNAMLFIVRSGVRTHADIRPLELKSNALTTRPSWLVNTGESLKVVALYTVIDSSRITGCFLVNFLLICVYLRSEKRYSTESRLLLLKPSLFQGMNIPIFLLKVW